MVTSFLLWCSSCCPVLKSFYAEEVVDQVDCFSSFCEIEWKILDCGWNSCDWSVCCTVDEITRRCCQLLLYLVLNWYLFASFFFSVGHESDPPSFIDLALEVAFLKESSWMLRCRT